MKEELRARNLKLSGNKPELLARLLAHLKEEKINVMGDTVDNLNEEKIDIMDDTVENYDDDGLDEEKI